MITQPKRQRSVRQPADRSGSRARTSPKFYADFCGIPSALNNGHTVNEYWMEQTHGRIGMRFTPFGPYRMPRPLYEYGLNEFNQQGGCPAGHTCNGNMDRDVDALWRAAAGRDIRSPVRPRPAHLRRLRRDDGLAGVRRDEVRDQGRGPGRVGPAGPARCPNWVDEPLRAVDLVARRRAAVGPVVDPPGRELGHDHARDRPHASALPTTTTIRTSRRITASAPARGTSSTAARSTARRPAHALGGARHAGRRDAGRHDAAHQDQAQLVQRGRRAPRHAQRARRLRACR